MPLIDTASTSSLHAANVVSPVAGAMYAHKRAQTRRAKSVRESNLNNPPEVVLINEFVENNGSPKASSTAARKSTDSCPPRSAKKRKWKLPLVLSEPPKPANGETYEV